MLQSVSVRPFSIIRILGLCQSLSKKIFFVKKTINQDGIIKYPYIVRQISQTTAFRLVMISKFNDKYILIAAKGNDLKLINIK